MRELACGGVDTAFDVAGTDQAVQLAIAAARPGGRVVLAGIPGDDWTRFRASVARRKGLTIAMVRRMNEAYPRAMSLVVRDQVDLGPLMTHRFPLAAASKRGATTVLIRCLHRDRDASCHLPCLGRVGADVAVGCR